MYIWGTLIVVLSVGITYIIGVSAVVLLKIPTPSFIYKKLFAFLIGIIVVALVFLFLFCFHSIKKPR